MADQLPAKLQLTVVTRDRKFLDVEVDEVILPGREGYLGILPGHTPLLAGLGVGILSYRIGSQETRLVLSWGFAEVLPDRVTVMAEGAFTREEIDVEDAKRQRSEAERELASLASHDEGFALVQARLEESIAKIDLVG